MKPRFLPVHLEEVPSATFDTQLARLRELTHALVDWLPPAQIDGAIPPETTA